MNRARLLGCVVAALVERSPLRRLPLVLMVLMLLALVALRGVVGCETRRG